MLVDECISMPYAALAEPYAIERKTAWLGAASKRTHAVSVSFGAAARSKSALAAPDR